ncbi:WRKY DNA-binding protein 2 [Actinidia rufa]|uniref:WRKY DNA-binding protein 2 n=1 Tax=Actinidia rufa TaxID=165716 RepID=A0A7J0DU07_9ERIC|nr:WRKY DNA-binding protein 2 [Actinidia rufa]
MGGFDNHVAIIGDWVPPSPSPISFFSALGDEISSRSITELSIENRNASLFSGPQEKIISGRNDENDRPQAGDQPAEPNVFSEQKMNSGGGLLERMAARTGFNAPRLNTESIRPTDLSLNSDVWSPYLTIPPGLSPTTLLESPVFLSNSLVLPSPTTGKFPFSLSGNGKNSTLAAEAPRKSKENLFEDADTSSFAFKPVAASGPSLSLGPTGKVNPPNLPRQNFSGIDFSVQPENSLKSQNVEPPKVLSQDGTALHLHQNVSRKGTAEHLSPPDEQQNEEADQRGIGDTMVGGASSEDAYNWRKYGQKQVKGSEHPRSYYKCTHPNCPVKKKVERSHEGHITEIIYDGAHNHPKLPLNRRSGIGPLYLSTDMQLDGADQTGAQIRADGDPIWTTVQKGTAGGAPNWRNENLEVTSLASVGAEYSNAPNSLNGTHVEPGDAVDGSSTFSNEEDEDDRATHGSISLGYDAEGDESESKRRKIEAYETEMSGASRAIREPRVVVQTTSEVDILDDGYRWRKSYYKCTSAGCTVRKHVERASHDLKSVITTYEGKHNHDVPAARNSSHVNSGTPNNGPAQSVSAAVVRPHLHRPEPSPIHNSMARFDGHPGLRSLGMPGKQQLGPPHGFTFGMNQPGLANLAMAGLGPNQGKLPVLPVHPYLGQQRLAGEMGFCVAERRTEGGVSVAAAWTIDVNFTF